METGSAHLKNEPFRRGEVGKKSLGGTKIISLRRVILQVQEEMPSLNFRKMIYIPRTVLTPLFSFKPSKIRSFTLKTRVFYMEAWTFSGSFLPGIRKA